jgi:hypothetical protein
MPLLLLLHARELLLAPHRPGSRLKKQHCPPLSIMTRILVMTLAMSSAAYAKKREARRRRSQLLREWSPSWHTPVILATASPATLRFPPLLDQFHDWLQRRNKPAASERSNRQVPSLELESSLEARVTPRELGFSVAWSQRDSREGARDDAVLSVAETWPHQTSQNLAVISAADNTIRPASSVRPRIRRKQHELPETELVETIQEQSSDVEEQILTAMTQPIFSEAVWNQLTGREYITHPERIRDLARTGEWITRCSGPDHDENDWIEWRESVTGNIDQGDVLVWTGKSRQEGFGSQLPWIKTRSLVPMSARALKDLLMDSTRVKTYNQWSTGRQDCWVAPSHAEEENDDPASHLAETKIVKARTQPPLGAKPMVAVTLLHARPIQDATTGHANWLVVSRAPGGALFLEDELQAAAAEKTSLSRSDMLLGVNYMEPCPGRQGEACILTSVTHVYSPAVPLMLAERLGVSSAVNFVKDIRALQQQQQPAPDQPIGSDVAVPVPPKKRKGRRHTKVAAFIKEPRQFRP